MKLKIFLISIVIPWFCVAQDYRYTNTLFSNSTKTSNVVYGNAAFINGPFHTVENSTTNQNLIMDIYRPTGDTFNLRPAVIFAHPGGFLNGSRTVNDMNAMCDSLARKGYVTATIDYRKGFNLTSNQAMHSIRAVYRGIQDGRTAVRFLRANATLYGIDPNKIYFVGSSAGSFIGLHAIYMDTATEIPSQTGVVNYTNITPPFSHTTPNLGPLDIGNNLSFNGKPDAVVGMWGAIQNTALITPDNSTPVLLIHGETDATVSFNSGSPFGFGALPVAFGSNPINTRLNQLGFTNHETYFVPGQGHEFHGTNNGTWSNGSGGNSFYPIIMNRMTQFFWKQHKPTANFDWLTSNNNVTFTDTSTGSLAWWWDFGDGNFSNVQNPTHTYSLAGNYTVKLYVENNIKSWHETTKNVVVPTLSTDELFLNALSIYPNPTKGTLQINWSSNQNELSYQLVDFSGKTVQQKQTITKGETISIAHLADGLYLMTLTANDVIKTVKVVKN
jgi:PKD repeat protein/poly(3-hydroxybutyrate) depolymerase